MTVAILRCDSCERIAHNLSMEGQTCNWRFPSGDHCTGTLAQAELERVLDPHLECDDCGRRADKMDMEGQTCNWRLIDGRKCEGILEAVDV